MVGNLKDLNKLGDYYMEQGADSNGLFSVTNPAQNFYNTESLEQPKQQAPPKGYFTKNKYIDENLTDLGPSFFGQYRENNSRFDDDITGLDRLQEGYNINNLRAEQQSGFNKVMSGLAKGVGLTFTTFAEGTIGLPFSIASGVMSAIDGDRGKEILYNAINNPFSRLLKSINDASEEILPNYYTKNEEDSPWWENIFTANFLGDKVLKVAGFTVGAALSGQVWAGTAARALSLNKARNAFEGITVMKDGKQLKKLADKVAAYADNPELFAGMFTDELAKAATQLQKAQPILKWTGAITGAIGEGKIEALNNSQEWFDKEFNNIRQSVPQLNQNIMVDLAKQYPNDFKMVATDYNSYEWQPVTERGYNMLQQKSDELVNGAIEKLTQDRIKYANFDFVTNLALLTLTDYFTFGKVYSGGYNTGSVGKKALTKIDKETGEIVRNIPSKATKVATVLQKPLREGPIEEMGQSWLSEIKAQQYGSEINDYLKTQIDPDAAESTISFINALGRAFANTYGNAEAWEEGVIGSLMGAMGTVTVRSNKNAGKKVPFKVGWEGGIWEDIGSIKDYNRLVNEIDVDEMNQYLTDVGDVDKKKRLIETVISLQALENGKQAAIDNKDPKAYKDQENMQLITLMQYFKAGGQLDLFFDKLNSMSDINEENVDEYRQMLAATDNFYEKAPKEDIIKTVKKNVEDTSKKLKEYSQIADNLQRQVGDNFTIEGMSTLTYLASQIKDWDNRSIEILNQLREMTKDEITFGSSEQAANFVEALNNKTILNPKEAKGLLNTISLLETGGNDDTFKQFLASPEGGNFKELISDLQKIRSDRVNFINAYNKFVNNPTLLNEELENTKKAVNNSIKKTAFNNAIDKFNDATTIQNIQQTINDILGDKPSEEDVMMFLNTLDSSDAPSGVKALGKRYRNLMKTRYQFDSTLAEMSIDDDLLDDVKKLIGVTANATNSSDLLLNIKSYDASNVSTDTERQSQIMDVITKLIEKVNEINKHQVSDPKPKKFDDEEISTGPQKSQFETVEGIQQSPMPSSFVDDETPYENAYFADEGLELMPDFGIEEASIPEPPIDIENNEQIEVQPSNLSEDQSVDPIDSIKKRGDETRNFYDEIEKAVDLPVSPEPLSDDVKLETIKVATSNEVQEYKEDETQSSSPQIASNMAFAAIPQYDPNGFKGRRGSSKIFKPWKETLNKESDAIIEDLSISQKDAYNIYEYLEQHDAFDIVNKINFKTGPDGTKLYIGYDPNLRLSNGNVVPLIFASINGELKPINMLKIPKPKWRTDPDVAVNKWLDIIQASASKNEKTDFVVVNKSNPFYVDFVFDGEVLYTPQNTVTANVKNATADRFGYIYNGVSHRITDDISQRDQVLSNGAADGRHVLYVKTANGRLIATPLSSVPLYLIFNTEGKDGKTPLELLKSAENGSMEKQLYDAAKRIVTAKNDGDYDQGFSKLSKIIKINYGEKTSKRSFFWDKTWMNFQTKQITNRFVDPRKFDSFKNSIIKNRQAQNLPIDEESITDVLIEHMLFNHDTGLISNTNPGLQRTTNYRPFTRLFVNGSPQNSAEMAESIRRLKNYTFTNVGDANTVRRNFNMVIPEDVKSDVESDGNNFSKAPVEPTYTGSVEFDGRAVNYNIAENGEVSVNVEVKDNEKNDLLNLITATEFFKKNPAAKTKQISNKVYRKNASGKITITDAAKKQTRPQPRQQPQQSGKTMKAGEYAKIAQMALGGEPIGEVSSHISKEANITIDDVITDKKLTNQILKDSLGDNYDETMLNLEDDFIRKYPNATIQFEQFLELREKNPNQNFECYGISII